MSAAGNQRKRRRGAAAVLAGVVLTGVAACGGDDTSDEGGKPTADNKPSAPAPLTEPRLRAVSFTDGEKVGIYTASEFTLGAPLGEADEGLADGGVGGVVLAEGATVHDPAAEVNRQVDVDGEMTGLSVAVQLRSYADGGAAAVLKALGAAGTQCAGGFTEERAIAKAKYLKVEPARTPAFGDEAKAYRFTILDVKGKLKLYEYLTVVRSGSATLSFRAEIIDTKDIGGVPEEVMNAQWEKFRTGRNAAP